MRKLTKDHIKQRDEIQVRLQITLHDLQAAVDAYNEALEEKWGRVEAAQTAYNEVIADANEWQSDVAREIQSYIDDRSEKWQESDKAQEYDSWREEFEDDIPEAEMEQPDELDTSEIDDAVEILGNRREEIES